MPVFDTLISGRERPYQRRVKGSNCSALDPWDLFDFLSDIKTRDHRGSDHHPLQRIFTRPRRPRIPANTVWHRTQVATLFNLSADIAPLAVAPDLVTSFVSFDRIWPIRAPALADHHHISSPLQDAWPLKRRRRRRRGGKIHKWYLGSPGHPRYFDSGLAMSAWLYHAWFMLIRAERITGLKPQSYFTN